MFVARALFWFAVVAVLMPRAPDLDLDVSRVRADLAGDQVRLGLVDDLRSDFANVRNMAFDPVRIYSLHYGNVLRERLNVVRTELAAVRPKAQANSVTALREFGFR